MSRYFSSSILGRLIKPAHVQVFTYSQGNHDMCGWLLEVVGSIHDKHVKIVDVHLITQLFLLPDINSVEPVMFEEKKKKKRSDEFNYYYDVHPRFALIGLLTT